jgi:hypothetical protein
VKLHSSVTTLGQQGTEAEPERLGVLRLTYRRGTLARRPTCAEPARHSPSSCVSHGGNRPLRRAPTTLLIKTDDLPGLILDGLDQLRRGVYEDVCPDAQQARGVVVDLRVRNFRLKGAATTLFWGDAAEEGRQLEAQVERRLPRDRPRADRGRKASQPAETSPHSPAPRQT